MSQSLKAEKTYCSVLTKPSQVSGWAQLSTASGSYCAPEELSAGEWVAGCEELVGDKPHCKHVTCVAIQLVMSNDSYELDGYMSGMFALELVADQFFTTRFQRVEQQMGRCGAEALLMPYTAECPLEPFTTPAQHSVTTLVGVEKPSNDGCHDAQQSYEYNVYMYSSTPSSMVC